MKSGRQSLFRPGPVAVCLKECRKSHAPWLCGCGIATRQTQLFQMCKAGEAGEVGLQDFPAPYGAVRAVAGAIENNCQHRLRQSVFGHHSHRVGMMVLDPV